MYVSNDRISLALTEVVDNVDTNLDDIKLFMEHSTKVSVIKPILMSQLQKQQQ